MRARAIVLGLIAALALTADGHAIGSGPFGGPIRPPTPQKPEPRDISGSRRLVCLVDVKFCPARKNAVVGQKCECVIEGAARIGTVRKISVPRAR